MNYLINIIFHISNFILFGFLSYWSGHYLNTLLQIAEPYNYITGLVGCGFLSYKIYQYFRVHRPIFNDIDYEKDNPEHTGKEKSSWTSWLWPIIFIIGIGLFSLAKSPEIKKIKKMRKEISINKSKLEENKKIKWKYYGKNKDFSFYARSELIKPAYTLRSLEILFNYNKTYQVNQKSAKSTTAILKIDCKTNKFSIFDSKCLN